jgi:hypothetical protein
MLRALTGQKPDVLPAAPAYLSLFLEDLERSAYIEQYRRRLRGRSVGPVDHDEDTLFRAKALYHSYSVFQVRPDWIELHRGASRAWAARTQIVDEGGILYYQDRSSGARQAMHEVPIPCGEAALAPANAALQDLWDGSSQFRGPEDVDARLPIIATDELLARGDFDLPRQVVADCGGHYFLTTILDTPFSDAYDLLGFQGLMLIQHDRPELLHHLLERDLAQAEQVMAAWAAVGIHGVYVQEVFTGADVISPRSYDRFVFAHNRPYFEKMSALGLLPIHYVCGDVIPRLERMCQYRVAAIAVEESKKAFTIEIADVVQRVAGRVAVLGNVDAVRFGLHATMEEMAAEVQRQARIGAAAKGFVVSTGSPFPLDTDPRLVDTLVATAHAVVLYSGSGNENVNRTNDVQGAMSKPLSERL